MERILICKKYGFSIPFSSQCHMCSESGPKNDKPFLAHYLGKSIPWSLTLKVVLLCIWRINLYFLVESWNAKWCWYYLVQNFGADWRILEHKYAIVEVAWIVDHVNKWYGFHNQLVSLGSPMSPDDDSLTYFFVSFGPKGKGLDDGNYLPWIVFIGHPLPSFFLGLSNGSEFHNMLYNYFARCQWSLDQMASLPPSGVLVVYLPIKENFLAGMVIINILLDW